MRAVWGLVSWVKRNISHCALKKTKTHDVSHKKSSVCTCLFPFLCCVIKENGKWGETTVGFPQKGKTLFIYIDVSVYPLKWAVCHTSIFYVPFLCYVTSLSLVCAGMSVRSCYSTRGNEEGDKMGIERKVKGIQRLQQGWMNHIC